RRDDPIYKAVFDERNNRRHPKPCRSERACEAHSDSHIFFEHLFYEKLARFAQPRSVVSKESRFDQLGYGHLTRDGLRLYRSAAEKVTPVRHLHLERNF